MPTDKKDYIFNLRLSRETVDKLRSRAVENGQTASQLARTMIKDGLEVFGDISEDLFGSTATKKSEKKKNEVVYYYDAILAHDTECADTGKKLKK